MKDERYAAFDGNWYLHRIFHTSPESAAESICSRFIGLVCADALALRATKILVAFDGPRIFRYKLYKPYKANRAKSSGVYDSLGRLLEYLSYLSIPTIQLAQYEADDVLASLATSFHPITLCTRDKDMFQCLSSSKIRLYDSAAKPRPEVRDRMSIEVHTGLKPELHRQYQALIGDKIDNIPSLMGPATAKKGLKTYGSISNWAASSAPMKVFLNKNREQVMTNRKLVTLVNNIQAVTEYDWKTVPKLQVDTSMRISKAYYQYIEFLHPKSRSLF